MSPIMVTGMSGSGTTHLWWILSHDPLVRNKFCEPLHPKLPYQIQKLDHYHDYARKRQLYRFWDSAYSLRNLCLNKGDRYPELKQYLKYILRGRTLVQTTKMNLRIAWLQSNFRGLKILYLVRDPRAVTLSLKDPLGLYMNLCSTKYSSYLFQFERASEVIKTFLLWKIHIEYALEISSEHFQLIRYEDLCLKTHDTLENIYRFLGRKVPYGVRTFSAIGTGTSDWSSRTNISTLTSWRTLPDEIWKEAIMNTGTSVLMQHFSYGV